MSGTELKRFNDLDDSQKDQARAMFINAYEYDGYWYAITGDGMVLHRHAGNKKEAMKAAA